MIARKNLREIVNEIWDVLIIGAGPAGSSAAITLAENNFRVLLIDKENFPREKVCGDGLIGDAQKVLERFGVLDAVLDKGYRVAKLSVFSPSRHEIVLSVPAITIQRKKLDNIILKKAVELGAYFYSSKIVDVSEKSNFVEVTDAEQNIYKAKYVLIATGADLSLLKSASASSVKTRNTIALRSYYKSASKLDRLIVTYDKLIMPGYGWIFPMGEGIYNIGCGVFGESLNDKKINLKELFEKFLKEFPLAKELVSKGERIDEIKGARLRCGLKCENAVINNRILVIGETISTTFNYTGEGIGKAMESGIIAGELVGRSLRENSNVHLEYPNILMQKYSGLFNGYRIAQKWLSNKLLTDFMIKRTRESDYLKNSITSVLNNDENPAKVFSIGGLLKSYIK